jgi:hypothetical protein
MAIRSLAFLIAPVVIATLPIPSGAQTQPQVPETAAEQQESAEPFVADGVPGAFDYEFAALLYGQSLDAGRAYAEARLAIAPEDETALMALGITQFADAVHGLARDMHRHGLEVSGGGLILPFFRVPVDPNSKPEPLDYESARQILISFVERLALAEATLAGVDDPAVELRLRPALIRFDTNSDGVWSDEERFSRIYGQYTPRRGDPEGRVDFDGSDAPWFRGYTHLLSAMAEAWLAYDWHEGFEASFHSLFPNSGLPNAALNELPRARQQSAPASSYDHNTFSGNMMEDAYIADLVAFFHLVHWPVSEPERLASAREHLKAMIRMSRESWRRIRAETDDAQEWVPAPHQAFASGENRPAAVTEETVAGWLQFLDTFEQTLDGKLLLPHWRLNGGINLKRVFLEPRAFDIVLWLQGSAALPYIEDGRVADSATWAPISQLMGGDFMTYFVWFN